MRFVRKFFTGVIVAVALIACSGKTSVHRTLRKVGAESLRRETLEACREGFAARAFGKIPEEQWPPSVRAFQPLGVWAEPDGAYILLDSDADGERGIYLPRILSDKDPLCGPKLTHVKLAEGVYWYDKKR